MNERQEQIRCFFHPTESVIGICAFCLKERLLVLSSKQKHQIHTPKGALPKIFALSGFINHLDHTSDNQAFDDTVSSTSHEDSFISIRFEDNGVASWDKGKTSKTPNETHRTLDKANKIKSVVEHMKPRGTLRWRKRIGHMLHVMRWRRSASKGNGSHVGKKLEGTKVKHGWIRILTKRRTKE